MLQLVVGVLLSCGGGCAGSPKSTTRPTRVAVLELETVGVTRDTARRVRRSICREIERAASVIDTREVDHAAKNVPGCKAGPEGDRCAVDAGTKVSASHVVGGAIGGLGKTFMLRLRVHDVRKNAVVSSLEQTRFGRVEDLPAMAGRLARRLFGTPDSPRWYKRWWVWTTVAAVAAGAVVAITVSARDSGAGYEDVSLP